MSDIFYGTAYMADYIGSTQSTVSNWAKGGESGFPEPAVVILSASGGVSARGWSRIHLEDARTWMEKRLGLTETEAIDHWEKVNDGRTLIRKDRPMPGQEKLF